MKNDNWFKQFWPWFLIILPLCAVVAGIATFVIAIENKPDMVVDDYYTVGKAINVDLSLLREAQQRGITANIHQIKNVLRIDFTGLKKHSAIRLSLYHPTLANRDLSSMLTADAQGRYHFESKDILKGKWQIRLEPFDLNWRLEKVIYFPSNDIKLQ
ncbi:FixH family protein [Psychromonas sp. CD1]|uniref:FixH family protein n=1 Tax=Psychromonas sp. CD1 TaxID=1979839 RepID=UPI000B9B7788|nr:FixH family protein [Psychromonas sp. CD1]